MVMESADILFVAWQDAAQRRYHPVARLVRHRVAGIPEYEFAYLNGAQEAQKLGFQPFLAFPELGTIYRSDALFPFFSNRLVPRVRGDYREYVQRLGLQPDDPDDFAILARSGGIRATDSIELFPFPSYEQGIGYTMYFCVHSLRYINPIAHVRVDQLKPHEELNLMHDFQNPVDPDAMALRTADRVLVGYLPGYLLEDVGKLQDGYYRVQVTVAQINPPPAPLSQRVLCRMECCWPDNLAPFLSSIYQPIASGASQSDAGVLSAT
jgi:hypothetical protein